MLLPKSFSVKTCKYRYKVILVSEIESLTISENRISVEKQILSIPHKNLLIEILLNVSEVFSNRSAKVRL